MGRSILLVADAGVPMIFLTLPSMAALLLPIVLVEAWLFRRWLGLDVWTAIKSSGLANVASTAIGVPGAWGVMFLLEVFGLPAVLKLPFLRRLAEGWHSPIAAVVGTFLSAAWLMPDGKNLYWMIPVASFALLIPTYFLSVWVEGFVVDHLVSLPDGDPSNLNRRRVRRAVRDANLVTYGLLATGIIGWLFFSLLRPPH